MLWFDSAVVKLISNADKPSETELTRSLGSQLQPFNAQSCVSHYNAIAQGVAHLDQLRGRVLSADGQTVKK